MANGNGVRRGGIDEVGTPHPIGPTLSTPLQDDDFAQRFTAGLDKVLAPVFVTLDNIDSYFDPYLAPDDFVDWLSTWVGLSLDENWPLEKQRRLIAQAVELYSWRGTIRGVSALVEIYAGVGPEITESGGVATSDVPGGQVPGTADATMKVTVRGASVEPARLDVVVSEAKPAHVTHEVEVFSA